MPDVYDNAINDLQNMNDDTLKETVHELWSAPPPADVYEQDKQHILSLPPERWAAQGHSRFNAPYSHVGRGGSLFLYLTADGHYGRTDDDCGCPAGERNCPVLSAPKVITDAVDGGRHLIPDDITSLWENGTPKAEILEAFCECQRAADIAFPGRYERILAMKKEQAR